jgi:hypothetical protein
MVSEKRSKVYVRRSLFRGLRRQEPEAAKSLSVASEERKRERRSVKRNAPQIKKE